MVEEENGRDVSSSSLSLFLLASCFSDLHSVSKLHLKMWRRRYAHRGLRKRQIRCGHKIQNNVFVAPTHDEQQRMLLRALLNN